MWEKAAKFILRQRLYIVIAIGLLTCVMGYYAQFAEIRYDFAKLLPVNDSTYIEYENFKQLFGEDGNVLFVGITDENLYELSHFNAWYDLGEKLKTVKGVEEVVSVARLYNLTKNDSLKKFDFAPVVSSRPQTQQEADSIKNTILSLPFYKGIVYNPESKATIMFITMSKSVLDNKERITVVSNIEKIVKEFSESQKIKTHLSGLPYIRSVMAVKVSGELRMFLFLAAIVTAIILYLFFRSFRIVFFCMIVVGVGVLWCMGLQGMIGYKISVLTGLVPPLLIIIGIPNCIFLLNRYHREFKTHGNQAKALVRVVSKIGNAALLTNTTTAAGFATFIIVESQVMHEFGIVASISIMLMFVISITLIPIVFSYIAPPGHKHTKHLDNNLLGGVINKLIYIVDNHRKLVYLTTVVVLIVSGIGISKMKATGNIVDDLPQDDEAYTGLKYFEKNFKGVMPFEIKIDTRKKGKVMSTSMFRKIDELQELLSTYPQFSKALSVVEVLKFSRQAFYNGDSSKYSLPSSQEQAFILNYVPQQTQKKNQLQSFIDSNRQITRVSVHIEDIGTYELANLRENIKPRIDSIFTPDKYDVKLTGTSVVFLKGNEYMIKNLVQSILLAILVISVMMALLFSSWKMVVISLIPNIIPQLVTAALMGYLGIPIKISTILVFSIAFGISVDNTIHFLAKYRQELKLYEWNIKKSVFYTLREAGISMIYTSIVLYFGFGIFMLSTFGGTKALGMLLSTTLIVAMLCNLFILPSLILSLEKNLTTKAFKEPLLEIFDEEEDIDLENLRIKKEET